MTPQETYALSCYQQIASINHEHDTVLVQHKSTGKIFVKKTLRTFNKSVYNYLLSNPLYGIPQVYEAIEDNDRLIIIEDYISGSTLQEKLNEQGVFQVDQVINIITQLCRIVNQLHKADPPIIHRDIKPENIILTTDGTVTLLDMNAARQLCNNKNKDTVLLGTEGYAAPEQYGFAQTDTRTDIYSIGVLINYLLTNNYPNNELADGQLNHVIIKCTKLNPSDRYQSIDDLLTALEKSASSYSHQYKLRSAREYLPPGFRSGKPLNMIIASIIYIFLIALGATLKIQRPLSDRDLLLYRIFCTLMLVGMALFTGNYLNIHNKLRLTNSDNIFIRFLGIILGNFCIFAITVIILSFFV